MARAVTGKALPEKGQSKRANKGTHIANQVVRLGTCTALNLAALCTQDQTYSHTHETQPRRRGRRPCTRSAAEFPKARAAAYRSELLQRSRAQIEMRTSLLAVQIGCSGRCQVLRHAISVCHGLL